MTRTKQDPPPPPPEPKALDPLPLNTQAILRSGAEAVAYHIPVAPPSSFTPVLKSCIALPRRSKWTSGLHFHTTHTEFIRLVKGSIFVELDGETKILSAKAGGQVSFAGEVLKSGLEITVNRYARHNWGRAEEYLSSRRPHGISMHRNFAFPEDRDEEVIVEEWTDPADIAKPLFFWNLNGVIMAPPDTQLSMRQTMLKAILGGWWIPFRLFVIFWDLDNWPIFFSLQHLSSPYLGENLGTRFDRLAEYVTTMIVLLSAKTLGKMMGIHAVLPERTPDDLWAAYKNDGPR